MKLAGYLVSARGRWPRTLWSKAFRESDSSSGKQLASRSGFGKNVDAQVERYVRGCVLVFGQAAVNWPCMDSFFWSTVNTVEAERSKDRKKHLLRYLHKARKNLFIEVFHECLLCSGVGRDASKKSMN